MQTIRYRSWIGITCVLAGLVLAGCGSGGTPPKGPGGSSQSCIAGSTSTVRLAVTDSGKVLCVAPGTEVDVYLQGSADRKWAPIEVSGNSLQAAPNGRGTLALGVTGGFFRATSPGTAYLSSQRPACAGASTGSNASPPGVACGALAAFRVTVQIP